MGPPRKILQIPASVRDDLSEMDLGNAVVAGAELWVGSQIRLRRQYRRLSQQKMADALGIIRQSYARWETGEARLSAGLLVRVAEILECDVVTFFEGLTGLPVVPPPPPGTVQSSLAVSPQEFALLKAWRRLPQPQAGVIRSLIDVLTPVPPEDVFDGP